MLCIHHMQRLSTKTVVTECSGLTVSLTWPLLFTSTPVLRRKTTSSRQPSRLAHTSPSDSSSTCWWRNVHLCVPLCNSQLC